MSDLFIRQAATSYGDGTVSRPRGNRRAETVVSDFWTQMLLDGRMFSIQIGTEDAPENSTTSIDDQLVWAVVDNNAGYVTIPFACQVKVANWTTATLFNTMLEADLAKARYSSGGTAFVPRNARGDGPYSYNGTAYICSAGGAGVTTAAKSAVPLSVEFWRGTMVEDAQATPAAADADIAFVYSARQHPLVALVDASSLLLHHGVATADCNSYGFLQFIQLDKALVV